MRVGSAESRRGAHNAALLGLTDLFVGASAIALLLIVIAKQVDQPLRIPQADVIIECEADRQGMSATLQGARVPMSLPTVDSLFPLLDQGRLTARVAVLAEGPDLACYRRVRLAVERHNRGLGSRDNAAGPVVLLDLRVGQPGSTE